LGWGWSGDCWRGRRRRAPARKCRRRSRQCAPRPAKIDNNKFFKNPKNKKKTIVKPIKNLKKFKTIRNPQILKVIFKKIEKNYSKFPNPVEYNGTQKINNFIKTKMLEKIVKN
jgi:hypothetical protein